MVEVTIGDPFALPADVKPTPGDDILRRGRYMLPWKDGSHKSRGFQRVSNLVSAYSDQFGLRMWEIEMVVRGICADPAVYAKALQVVNSQEFIERWTKDERKAWVTEYIEHAKEAARANEGSKFGNLRHAQVEELHAGLPTGHHAPDARRHLALYESALVRHKLRALPGMQERIVLVESLEVVGTLDNVLEDLVTGILHIGDLKTQRRFWTWLEISAQFACYSRADAMWDRDAGVWVDFPKVSQEVAMALSMPRPPDAGTPEAETWEPHVDIYNVDVAKGWETAKRAYEVVKDRAAAKTTKNPRGWLRPAPDITETERFAARFAAVETLAEGRALVAEATKAGVWGEILRDAAEKARDRIAVKA